MVINKIWKSGVAVSFDFFITLLGFPGLMTSIPPFSIAPDWYPIILIVSFSFIHFFFSFILHPINPKTKNNKRIKFESSEYGLQLDGLPREKFGGIHPQCRLVPSQSGTAGLHCYLLALALHPTLRDVSPRNEFPKRDICNLDRMPIWVYGRIPGIGVDDGRPC